MWSKSDPAGQEQLLAYYQGTGEFRPGFDPHVMAMAIRAAINAVPAQPARDPALDISHHAHELSRHLPPRHRADRNPPDLPPHSSHRRTE